MAYFYQHTYGENDLPKIFEEQQEYWIRNTKYSTMTGPYFSLQAARMQVTYWVKHNGRLYADYDIELMTYTRTYTTTVPTTLKKSK